MRVLVRLAFTGVLQALLLGAGLVGPWCASGAQAPATFTLADAAALARRQHPLLVAAGGRAAAATGAARQESALPNPVFEWRRENYGSPLDPDEFLSLGLPIELYGRRTALRAAGASVAARPPADSATAARRVEYDLARAYWRTALAYALRDASTAHRFATDTIARIEAERARQGQVSNGSAMRARLEADRARLAEAASLAELERARGDLAQALAMPFDSVPRPTESLIVDASVTLPSVDALLAAARERRTELVSARSYVTEASRRQLAERLGSFPGIGMQAGSKRTSGFLTGTLQVGITVPFFDRNSGNRQRAQGELLIAQSELRAAESGVSAEIVSAVRAYRALAESYTGPVGASVADGNGLRDLELRGDSVATIAAVAYREGAIPLFELLDAERARTDVRASALRAAAELHMARIDLLRALGLPVDGARLLPAPH